MKGIEFLQSLGIGLSRALRYTFGGFLLIVIIAFVDASTARVVREALGWELTSLCALVIGTGIYAVHRSLVIPFHHLMGFFILNVGEFISYLFKIGEGKWYQRFFHIKKNNLKDSRVYSLSPTRWLGYLGVPFFRRMIAYTRLRMDYFDDLEKTNLNVIHAENGLSVMISEAFLGTYLYLSLAQQTERIDLLIVGVSMFIFSAISGIQQHRAECVRFKEDQQKVERLIRHFKTTNSVL